MLEIVLTREDANTEFALLSEWLVANRAEVAEGQPVCVVETTKATVEVEAPGAGTIVQLFEEGVEVELGKTVAYVAESADELASLDRTPSARSLHRSRRRRIARRRERPQSSQSGTESTSRRSRSGASSPRRTSRSSSRARRPPRRNADRRSPVSRPRTSRSPRRSSSTRRQGRSTSDFLDALRLGPRLLPAPLARREDLDPEGARSADRRRTSSSARARSSSRRRS